jgi:ribosomal protein S8
MSMTDPLADLLARVPQRRAGPQGIRRRALVTIKERVARVMVSEGFLQECSHDRAQQGQARSARLAALRPASGR